MLPKLKTFFHRKQSWTRHVAHVMFWVMVILSVVLYLGVIDVYGHDDEWFLTHFGILSAFGLLLPWMFAMYLPILRKNISEYTLGISEFLLSLGLIFAWIGGLGTYRYLSGYDDFNHFIISALGAAVFLILVLSAYPSLAAHPLLLLLIIVLLTVFCGLINEFYEWGGDMLFGTSMYGEVGQSNDTLRDLIDDILGAAIGWALAYRYRRRLVR